MKPITIYLPENLYAIASAEAGQLGVDRYLEHFVADYFYQGIKPTPKGLAQNVSSHSAARFSNSELPATVLQIFAIVRSMNDEGLSFRKAVKVAANEFGVNESTIQDKCTRRISISSTNQINTDKFIELLKTKNLVNHLCQKFPDHREAIIKKFQIITGKNPFYENQIQS
jgi:hypothetical protein